jgi:3-hydroxyacyl-[acyl-carrier-protein] dehydratase
MGEDSRIIPIESDLYIRKNLPQRYPFLFIDKIKLLEPGKTIATIKNVTYSDCFGEPNKRFFPSEYLMEMFGQAAIILFYADTMKNPDEIVPLFVGIESFDVSGTARAGDCVEAEATFEKVFSKATIMSGRAFVNGEEIARAKFSAAFVSKPG